MIPAQIASDGPFHPFAQGYTGGIIVPRVRQPSPSLPPDTTIDPMLLMYGNHGPPPQHNPPPLSLYIPEDNHYQHPSPSTSTEVWMGYAGDEGPASIPSPISPTVGNRDVAYATFADSCVCGCDAGACIPQREYDRQRTDPLTQYDLQEMILFSVNGKCGFPLEDALKKCYTGLDGRDDKMFVDFKSSISIRLEWLPYDKWTKQIRTLTWRKNPDHITRAKLATEVAKRMKIFFEEMQSKDVDPSHQEYRVKPGLIDLNHLELVALKRVAKSSYMPHFRLITPSHAQ